MSQKMVVNPTAGRIPALTSSGYPQHGLALESGRSAAASSSQAVPTANGTHTTSNFWTSLSPQIMAKLAPTEIENRLGQLIRGCLSQRSAVMAFEVMHHIEALCAHPDYHGSWEERCAYRRLAQHWRGLAWITTDQAEAAKGQRRERA